MKWFKKRHPQYPFKTSKRLDNGHIKELCFENVARIYKKKLQHLYSSYNYESHQIWNVDEGGIQVGQANVKTIVWRSSKNVSKLISNEKESINVLTPINVCRETIENNYIFEGMQKRDFVQLSEKDKKVAMQPNAWLTTYLFYKLINV